MPYVSWFRSRWDIPAAILLAAMMLKFSFGLNNESAAIENAVDSVLRAGARTQDIVAHPEPSQTRTCPIKASRGEPSPYGLG